MTFTLDQEAIFPVSASYEDLAEALDIIAPHRTPPTNPVRHCEPIVPVNPDGTKRQVDELAPGWAYDIVVSGTVYSFGGVPVIDLEGTQRKDAIQAIIDSMYRYEVKPVRFEVLDDGVKFAWRVAGVWHPEFVRVIFGEPKLRWSI